MIDPTRGLLLTAGAGMLVLTGALLTANARDAVHRALAVLLACRGMAVLLPQVSADPAWVHAALQAQPYFALGTVPAALWLAAATRARHVGWWALAAAVLLEALYAADHALFQTLGTATAATPGAMRAGGGLAYLDFGPLAAVASLASPAIACAGLACVVAYRRGTALLGSLPGTLLVGMALTVGAAFDAASRIVALADLLDHPAGYAWTWGWAVAFLPILALVPVCISVLLLVAERREGPRPALEGAFLGLVAAVFGAGFLRLALAPDSNPAGTSAGLLLLGATRLLVPALVACALVAVPGRGARAREGVAWAGVAGTAAAVGWIAAAIADPAWPAPGPLLVGIGAASAVAASGRPLLRLMRSVAGWFVPETAARVTDGPAPPGR